MARLKQVVLKGKIDKLRASMAPLEEKRSDIAARKEALKKREDELMQALGEVTDEMPEEDRTVLEEQVDECVRDIDDVQQEDTDNEQAITDLQNEIDQLEQELEAVEAKLEAIAAQAPAGDTTNQRSAATAQTRAKEENHIMHKRTLYGLTYEERSAMFRRDESKAWLNQVRAIAGVGQQRAVNNGEVAIPTVVLGVIRDNMESGSKLIKHVNLQRVPGDGRETILGVTPEAIWTEACGKLNEIDLDMFNVEVDGYKVGAFIPVCNALLEDADDVALGDAVVDSIIKGIGLAIDKAITYGTGYKMPLGIVTRLAQTADPGTNNKYRPWEDLSDTNIVSIPAGTEGVELYAAIMTAASAADGDYSAGEQFWVMSRKTRTSLMAAMLSITANGAVASAVDGELPLIGGKIETLNFMPAGVMAGGYGKLYLLAERAGATVSKSEHVRFIEDQTVFKGTARYDGKPVIPEAFVAMHINGGTVTANAVTFAQDKANAS